MFVDNRKSDAELRAMLASGAVEMHYRIPILNAWRVAALKHAYLGACLSLGGYPTVRWRGRSART